MSRKGLGGVYEASYYTPEVLLYSTFVWHLFFLPLIYTQLWIKKFFLLLLLLLITNNLCDWKFLFEKSRWLYLQVCHKKGGTSILGESTILPVVADRKAPTNQIKRFNQFSREIIFWDVWSRKLWFKHHNECFFPFYDDW